MPLLKVIKPCIIFGVERVAGDTVKDDNAAECENLKSKGLVEILPDEEVQGDLIAQDEPADTITAEDQPPAK